VVATAAEDVGVEVMVEEDWAAARVKPAATTRVVSCMMYGRENLYAATGIFGNECTKCERWNVQ
jgi:hypothetical protein